MTSINKFLVLLISITLCVNMVRGQESSHFTIHGTLKNFKIMPEKVFLIYPDYENKKPDSSAVINGKYQFSGNIGDDAIMLTLTYGPEPDPMSDTFDLKALLIITKGETNIVSDGTISNVTETGASGKAFDDYKLYSKQYFKDIYNYLAEKKSLEYLTRLSYRQKVYTEFVEKTKKHDIESYNFIIRNPHSAINPLLAHELPGPPAWGLNNLKTDTLINILSAGNNKSKVRTATLTSLGNKAKEFAAKQATSAGRPAPDFSQNDVNGNPVKLSSFRGKYVLIDFWASWCAPCRAENPNVVKVYAKYHDKNFEILGVSLDGENGKDAWEAAIKKDGLTWPQVSDLKGWKNEAAKIYTVTAIPQNFLVDPDGKIIATNLRGDDLEKALEKYLK